MIFNFLRSAIKANSLFTYVFSILHGSNFWRHPKSVLCRGAILRNVKFVIRGRNSCVLIPSGTVMTNCEIRVYGDNCKIVILGGANSISNTVLWVEDDNSQILIGAGFTMQGGQISATEGKSIEIGNDCMFSSGIDIRNGDSHGIFSLETGQRQNFAEDVKIGNHVWLTKDVTILKGSSIANNIVVGNKSVVSGLLDKENAIYSGIPARLIKDNVVWDRYRVSKIDIKK